MNDYVDGEHDDDDDYDDDYGDNDDDNDDDVNDGNSLYIFFPQTSWTQRPQ